MKTTKAKKTIQKMLSMAGMNINGKEPWDIKVHHEGLYRRVIAEGSIGLGESYMDGWWDVDQLDAFIHRIVKYKIKEQAERTISNISLYLQSKLLNMQSKLRAKVVAEKHYNLGNDLYMSFLDPYNQYTCGYFKNTTDLNVAQEQKLKLICEKLQLQEGDRVLDIGCGWGGFAKYAASHYGCHVTGITISDEQIKYAKEFTKDLPVDIIKKDYRDLDGKFSKVLICGMIEHVGYKNYQEIMDVVHRCLDEDGLFLLHTIGSNTSSIYGDPWSMKYIFPNSMLPSIKQLASAVEGLFVMEDWHNFGHHYATTLKAWFQNFDTNWDQLKSNYDERFYRMWKYYLLSFAGAFQARDLQLWQIVLSKEGMKGGYITVR